MVPAWLQADAQGQIAANGEATVLQHGYAHKNHAKKGAKSIELGGRAADRIAKDLRKGFSILEDAFGAGFLPVLVPPWNRIDAGIVAQLPQQGYVALSTYTPRAIRLAAPGLVQINTHMDPVHWRAGGGLVSPELQIAALVQVLTDRREGQADATEPLGFLTHHLVHDAAIWEFTRACLSILLAGGAVPCDLRDALP